MAKRTTEPVPDQDIAVHAFLICDTVSFDASGRTYINGIFDTVFFTALPALHPTVTAFFRLSFAKRRGPLTPTIQFHSPSGSVIELPAFEVKIPPTGILQASVTYSHFPLYEEGSHEFRLSIFGKCWATFPFSVQPSPTETRD